MKQQMNLTPELAYDLQVDQWRRKPYIDYPTHVHLETLAVCNGSCRFCPASTLKRRGTKMSDALIEKVLTELEQIPRELTFQLSPFKVNEPLLDARLLGILRDVDRRLPNARITLTTNATPLTDEKINELSALINLDSIAVSLNECRKDAYEQAMGLSWDRVIDRLDALHAALDSRRLQRPVRLSRVGDGASGDASFRRWGREHYPLFEICLLPPGDWLGQVEFDAGAVPKMGCKRWFELSITATGVVAHCCMDGRAQYPIGDINKQTVLEVYNSPDYRRLREKTVWRQHVEPCRRCTFA